MTARAGGVTLDRVLKVHAAVDGGVWYAEGGGSPVDSRLSMAEFLAGDVCLRSLHVRMVGSRDNAPLLVGLWQRKLRGTLHRLEVASPAVIGRTRNERRNPRLMLDRIRDTVADGLPAVFGGWHEFSDTDFPAYYLAATEHRASECALERVEVLTMHPAWRALSFIPHLAADRLASLLGEILDPRWYSSVREPRGSDIIFVDDSAKLHAFLGLKPATMAGVLGLTEPDGEGDRCRLVVDTWMTGQPDSGLAEWPGYFLWRRHRREQTQLKAVLRASQFFVDFLRLVWLDGLYTDRTAGRPAAPGKRPATEGPFAPDHFFAVSDDAVSFGRHMLAGV
jgi:hypothetical protein